MRGFEAVFGWLKNKFRNENAKLLKQNEMAASYLVEIHREAASAGIAESGAMIADFEMVAFHANMKMDLLDGGKTLPPDVFDQQLELNKALRREYAQVMAGRRAFAEQFGSASEPLLPFDRIFQPNEGWKIFFAHLPK